MKRKRRQHSAEFKARVALEALRGIKTVNQIAEENEIHPVQVSQWKAQLQERIPEVFAGSREDEREQQRQAKRGEQLERKVGQLIIEKEFLEKKCEQLGIDLSERP
jgi:transposase